MDDSLGGSLDQALEAAFTRRIPQSAQAQMKYLVKQLKGTKAAAQALGVSSAPWSGTSRASSSGPAATSGIA
jgi:hypothetical protein